MLKTFLFLTIQFNQTILIQPIQYSISIVFVYTVKWQNSSISNISVLRITVSMSQTVLFQPIQFSISTRFCSIWPIDMVLIKSYHFGPMWTRERWQWSGGPHSLKLQHYWNLTIRLFRVISGHSLRGGDLNPMKKSSWCILQPQPTVQITYDICDTHTQTQSYTPIYVTYWPSTQPSIEKQEHPVEDITLTCGQVEFGADATPTRSRWMSNNYITRCHRQFELIGVRQLKFELQFEAVRTSS